MVIEHASRPSILVVNWVVNLTTLEIANTFHAKRFGKGRWMARCPIHGKDRTPSLEIKQGRNIGTTIVGCYAGCEKTVVLAAVGRV